MISTEKREKLIAELDIIHKAYDENFKNLCKYVGRPEHRKYLRIERRLNDKCIEIQTDLGINFNPCPGQLAVFCNECTGRYIKHKYYSGHGIMVEKGGTKCSLKEVGNGKGI